MARRQQQSLRVSGHSQGVVGGDDFRWPADGLISGTVVDAQQGRSAFRSGGGEDGCADAVRTDQKPPTQDCTNITSTRLM